MSSCMSRFRDQGSWIFQTSLSPDWCNSHNLTLASCGLTVLNKHGPLKY